MKIQEIEIKEFRHIKNLKLDFTYKSGEKKGQPLDKVCIIGQSATGKTSILEFIFNLFSNLDPFGNFTSNSNYKFDIYGQINIRDLSQNFYLNLKKENKNLNITETNIPSLKFKNVYYFTSNTLNNSVISFISDSKNIYTDEQLKQINSINHVNYNLIKFDEDFVISLWNNLLTSIIAYRSKLLLKGSELVNKGILSNYKKLEMEMEKWKSENINPLNKVADICLNPILKKLNLEVDLVDTSSLLVLKHINDEKPVPTKGLSTGTKQILLTAYPLFKLQTEDSVILLDEPERSLYPDMQMDLIEYYQNIAPKAQFIVATHSPFIAASFEPEERFILYFDEKGEVKVRQGESPIGDDANDMLIKDFGLDSYLNKIGNQVWKDYLKMKSDVKSEKDPVKKKELLKEVEAIGERYNFPE